MYRSLRTAESESALEQGWLLAELHSSFGLGHDVLAQRFGRSPSWVSRRLALVSELPQAVQDEVRRGRIGAHAAMTAGLVLRVVEEDALHAEAMRVALSISAHSAAALRKAKETLRAGAGLVDRTMMEASRIYLDDLMRTTDATEGLQSFIEKRQPHWTHS